MKNKKNHDREKETSSQNSENTKQNRAGRKGKLSSIPSTNDTLEANMEKNIVPSDTQESIWVNVRLRENKRESREISVKSGTILHDFFQTHCPRPSSNPIVGAKINFEQLDLWTPITKDCILEAIDLTTYSGVRVYERSLVLLLWRAVEELYPNCRLEVRHSISRGLYCEIQGITLRYDIVQSLERHMLKLVVNNEEFVRREVSIEEAIAIFEQRGMRDKARLLKRHQKKNVILYQCGNTIGSFYGRIVPYTSYLRNFELKYYSPGLILRFPDKESPQTVPTFQEQSRLFRVFQEHKKWAEVQEVNDIGELNQVIDNGKISSLIHVAEAIQEKKIAQIADTISQDRNNLRMILIAGPSSSGKTTFAKRLSVQLKVNGITTIPISLDDYFRNRDEMPRDEEGEQDFEGIEAIDIHLLNEHLQKLADGQEVMLPVYNFKTGCRDSKQHALKIKTGEILILEGIHALNDKLTALIPELQKFKIYISALTVLNIDSHNRIPTTDLRIIRRTVRDHNFRNYTAHQTLKRFPSVRRGENKNIFPFQNHANVMFNSAIIYELAALKASAVPLLEDVPHDAAEYSEAQRLLTFLSYFHELPAETMKEIPPTSIIREFIGGSSFLY